MFLITYLITLFGVIYSYKYSNADYMDSLDYLICAQIKEPGVSFCATLCDHLDKYYDNLESLLECLRKGDTQKVEAISGYWALGKPKCTEELSPDMVKNLETALLETEQNIKTFNEKVAKVKQLWEEFKRECEQGSNKYLCDPIPGYHA